MKNDLLKLNKKDFLIKYGHLRPGTYDITSKNYKSNYKEYFNHKNSHHKKTNYNKKKKFTINKKTRLALKKLGIYKNINDLFDFIKDSIAQREYSKFIFSKSIDYVFENLKIFEKDLEFQMMIYHILRLIKFLICISIFQIIVRSII